MKPITPWSGWIGGFVGWSTSHQLGSYLAQLDCAHATGRLLLLGFLAAALVIVSGLMSWRVWRMPGEASQPYAGTRRFIGGTGTLVVLIFLLAIVFQTISPFFIPPCYA